jgi:pimeloyl-ACP methyl ester carboxylesterase
MTLPGIGHVPQLEAPAQVAQLITRHLAKFSP